MKWGRRGGGAPSKFLEELDPAHLRVTSYHDIMGAEVGEDELGDFFGQMEDFLKG